MNVSCLKALGAWLHWYAFYVINSCEQGKASCRNRPFIRKFGPRKDDVLFTGFYCTWFHSAQLVFSYWTGTKHVDMLRVVLHPTQTKRHKVLRMYEVHTEIPSCCNILTLRAQEDVRGESGHAGKALWRVLDQPFLECVNVTCPNWK